MRNIFSKPLTHFARVINFLTFVQACRGIEAAINAKSFDGPMLGVHTFFFVRAYLP